MTALAGRGLQGQDLISLHAFTGEFQSAVMIQQLQLPYISLTAEAVDHLGNEGPVLLQHLVLQGRPHHLPLCHGGFPGGAQKGVEMTL